MKVEPVQLRSNHTHYFRGDDPVRKAAAEMAYQNRINQEYPRAGQYHG